MLMHAVTWSLHSKEEKTIEYMEYINRVGASNDPATLRCGITTLQKSENYRIYGECINHVDACSDVVTALQRKIKAEVKHSLQSRAV